MAPPLPARDRARQDWLCERATAERERCPDCDQPAGETCIGLHGQVLTRFPAHPGRITAAARTARTHATQPDTQEERTP